MLNLSRKTIQIGCIISLLFSLCYMNLFSQVVIRDTIAIKPQSRRMTSQNIPATCMQLVYGLNGDMVKTSRPRIILSTDARTDTLVYCTSGYWCGVIGYFSNSDYPITPASPGMNVQITYTDGPRIDGYVAAAPTVEIRDTVPYPGDLFTKAVFLHYDPVYYFPADPFFGFLDYQIFHPTPPTVMMIGPAYDTTIALSAQNLPVVTFQETHTPSTANITWSNGPTINTADFFSQMGADTAIDVTVYASDECGDTVSMSDEIIFTKDMLDHFVVTADPDTIIHNASSTITVQAQDVNNNNIAIPDETELTITFDPGNLGTPSILMFAVTAKGDKNHSVPGALNKKLKALNKSTTIQGNDNRLMRPQQLVEKKGAVDSDRPSSAGNSFNAQGKRSISKPQFFLLPTAGSITCIYAEANGGSLVYNADGVEPAQNQTVQITATKTDDGNKKGSASMTVKSGDCDIDPCHGTITMNVPPPIPSLNMQSRDKKNPPEGLTIMTWNEDNPELPPYSTKIEVCGSNGVYKATVVSVDVGIEYGAVPAGFNTDEGYGLDVLLSSLADVNEVIICDVISSFNSRIKQLGVPIGKRRVLSSDPLMIDMGVQSHYQFVDGLLAHEKTHADEMNARLTEAVKRINTTPETIITKEEACQLLRDQNLLNAKNATLEINLHSIFYKDLETRMQHYKREFDAQQKERSMYVDAVKDLRKRPSASPCSPF